MTEFSKWLACGFLVYSPYIASGAFSIHCAPQLLLISITTACISLIPLILTSILYSQIRSSETFSARTVASVLVAMDVTLQFALRLFLAHVCVHVNARTRVTKHVIYRSSYGLVPQHVSFGLGMAFISTITGAGVLLYSALEPTSSSALDTHDLAYAGHAYPGLSFLVHVSLQSSLLSLCQVAWTVMTGWAIAILYSHGYARVGQLALTHMQDWWYSMQGVRARQPCSRLVDDTDSVAQLHGANKTTTSINELHAQDVVLTSDTGDEHINSENTVRDVDAIGDRMCACSNRECHSASTNRSTKHIVPFSVDSMATSGMAVTHEQNSSFVEPDLIHDGGCSSTNVSHTDSTHMRSVGQNCDCSTAPSATATDRPGALGSSDCQDVGSGNVRTCTHEHPVAFAVSRRAREEDDESRPMTVHGINTVNLHSCAVHSIECKNVRELCSEERSHRCTSECDFGVKGALFPTPCSCQTGTRPNDCCCHDEAPCTQSDVRASATRSSLLDAYARHTRCKEIASRQLYHAALLLIASMSMQLTFSGVSLLHMENSVIKDSTRMAVPSVAGGVGTFSWCIISLPVQLTVTIASLLCTQCIIQYSRMSTS